MRNAVPVDSPPSQVVNLTYRDIVNEADICVSSSYLRQGGIQ
jgi:hypothetical protein